MGLVGTNCRELCFASTQLIRQEGGGIFEEKTNAQVEDEQDFFQTFFKTHENLNQKFGYRKTTYKSWSLFAECSEMFFCVTLQSKSALWIQEFHVVFLK